MMVGSTSADGGGSEFAGALGVGFARATASWRSVAAVLTTRTKVAIARLAYSAISAVRRRVGLDHSVRVVRDGACWELDLREGIDLAIYLGLFEAGTSRALRRLVRPGAVVLDVGANIGAHTLRLAKLVGESGRVIAFEPTVYAHTKLLA